MVQTNGSTFEEQVTVDVKRVLYGSYDSEALTFRGETDRVKSMKREVDLAREPNVSYDRPQLLFLRRSANQQTGGARIVWTLRNSVLLKQSSQGLATVSGRRAKTAYEFLKVVEDERSSRPTTTLGVDVESGPDRFCRTRTLSHNCFGCIARKGAVVLRVSPTMHVVSPAYLRFQAHVLDLCQSEDFRERERGVFMLRSYPGDVARRMLTSLLQDDGANRWNMPATTECVTYMVRAAAYDVLRDQGIMVPKPLLDECHTR